MRASKGFSTYALESQIRADMKAKKAVITVLLLEESLEKSNRELEREIVEALSIQQISIPWMKSVVSVAVKQVDSL